MATEAKLASYRRLQKKSKFSARVYNRCKICGRSGAYMREFGMCRICFRTLAHKGEIPGVTKSSW